MTGGASTYYEGFLGKGLPSGVRILDQFSCRSQGTFQVQLRRVPSLDKRLRMSFESCQLKLEAWVSHRGEDMGQGDGRRPQELALPGNMTRRGLERDTSPSVAGWQEAIYKGSPCTGHLDKAARGDLGAISRNSRWEPGHAVRRVGRDRL